MEGIAKTLRIVYMGTPDFAVAPLRELVEQGYNVVAVVTAVDKPAGRGLKLQESAVKQFALRAGIPVLQPERLKSPEFIADFEALNADLGIVIAFRMLPEVVWANPRLGTFNLHASLLPQYRGAAPINWAVINGEKQTGVTTFMLNHEIDKGDILGQRAIDIEDCDTAGTLHDKLMNLGVGLVIDTVEKIASGKATPIDQNSISATTIKDAPKIFKSDCRIDWSGSCIAINNFIRGLSPYPAAWTMLGFANHEAVGVKIFDACAEPDTQATTTNSEGVAGRVISDGRTYIKIGCADGYISIKELQMAGKKRMKTDEFLRGVALDSPYTLKE